MCIRDRRRIEGAKDMAEREYIGPKRIVIKPQGKENEAEARGKTLTCLLYTSKETAVLYCTGKIRSGNVF